MDPLAGQGIHRDGAEAISLICFSRENCEGGNTKLYEDLEVKKCLFSYTLEPGSALHMKDLELYHFVSPVKAIDPTKLMHRSMIVLVARFQDEWQHKNNVNTYAPMGKKCFVGKSKIEQLFDLIDEDGNGELDKHEFFTHMGHLLNGDMAELFERFDTDGDGKISRDEFVSYISSGNALDSSGEEDVHFW